MCSSTSASPTLTEQVNSLINGFLGEKDNELEQVKKELDEERRKVNELRKCNRELEKRQNKLVDKYTDELSRIEKVLEDFGDENARLVDELEMEKKIKDRIISEYTELIGRNPVLMQAIKDSIERNEPCSQPQVLVAEKTMRALMGAGMVGLEKEEEEGEEEEEPVRVIAQTKPTSSRAPYSSRQIPDV